MKTPKLSTFLGGLCCALLAQLAPLHAEAAPKIEHWQTPSGARVYFVENHSLPIVDVQVDFAAGSAYDPPGRSGTAAMARSLLDHGAGDLDETQIATRLADIGALLGGGADFDRASVSLRTLSAPEKRGPAFDVLRAVLSAPRFPQEVFVREQARSVAALREALTRPETIVSRTFWSAMYGAHPYGRQATPESLASLQRDELPAFYQTHYSARRATVSIVGDLARAEAEALAQRLTEALPSAEGSPAGQIPAPAPVDVREQRIAHPAAQAHLLIGLPTIKRGDPDFFPLLVGNYTLGGGGFVSRLMKEVRDRKGYAYSVHSYFMPLAQPGPFQIGLQTKKAQADEALALTRSVLQGFVAQGPSEAELLAAKQNIVGSFPLRLDSNRKLLDNVAVIGFYGLPLDYLDRYAANVEKVTAAQVREAFARHVKPAGLSTVLVGAAE